MNSTTNTASTNTATVHLVDIDGFDVPVTEKDAVPHDPTDAANWPAWTDNWFWECEPAVMAELEAVAIAAECDRRDAPDPWPTDEEIAEYERWQEQAEASRDFYRRNGSFGDWIAREGGSPELERDAFGNWFNA
jgi:hypothetical protein